MSLELEAYRGFITELWHIQQVNEEDIVSRLEEEYNLTTEFVFYQSNIISPQSLD